MVSPSQQVYQRKRRRVDGQSHSQSIIRGHQRQLTCLLLLALALQQHRQYVTTTMAFSSRAFAFGKSVGHASFVGKHAISWGTSHPQRHQHSKPNSGGRRGGPLHYKMDLNEQEQGKVPGDSTTTNNNNNIISPPLESLSIPVSAETVSSHSNSKTPSSPNVSTTNPTTKDEKNPTKPFVPNRQFFAEEDITALKESVDIVSVVESFGLDDFHRKSPDSATALCPFHNDHNPSLSISNQRGLYKCFSCGVGGDVFSFVREIHQVQQGQEMSFIESVRFVDNEYGGDANFGSSSKHRLSPDSMSFATETPELKKKRQRLYLANAAAAVFYVESLTKPFAGGARRYLTVTRRFTPTTIRRFSMGYAPDCYYGPKRGTVWGQGGVVEHLRSLNFTAQECVDAGLAVVVQSKQNQRNNQALQARDQKTSLNNGNMTTVQVENIEEDQVSFDCVMDRFRGRVVVPILDANGKHVVAFGGRTLPSLNPEHVKEIDNDKKKFEGPKYLNSPETLVFHKQQLLFGNHLAKMEPGSNSLVVVEGYLDAVALSSIGITNVVATMGAAISSAQLERAAQSFQNVILCMDNDDAGQSAVERICRDGKIAKVISKYPQTKFCVASSPSDFKDPAELVEFHQQQNENDIQKVIENEILNKAQLWTHWFVQRILQPLEEVNEKGEEQDTSDLANQVFHQLAELLSECHDSKEKSGLTRFASTSLATLLAPNASDAIGHQLESDLQDLSSRMAAARNATLEGDVPIRAHKGRVQGIAYEDKLSRKAAAAQSGGSLSGPGHGGSSGYLASIPESQQLARNSALASRPRPPDRRLAQSGKSRRRPKWSKKAENEPQLTPHFSGFDFTHQTDIDWLESLNGGKGILGLDGTYTPEPAQVANSGYARRIKPKRPVYFNSNEYHGKQFLTPSAIAAGYSPVTVKNKDPAIFQKGVGTLVQPDTTAIGISSENSLLRELILNPIARTYMKNWAQARSSLSNDHSLDIEWSSSEREWLLGVLMEDPNIGSSGAKQPQEVRDILAAREDAPSCAFDHEEEGLEHEIIPDETQGILEDLFVEVTSSEEQLSLASAAQVEFYLQDILGGMLWVSARRECERVQAEILLLLQEIQAQQGSQDDAVALDNDKVDGIVAEVVCDQNLQATLTEKLKLLNQVTQRMRSIDETRKRTSARALDANNSLKVEGRMSSALREKLCSEFEDFVFSIPSEGPLGPNEEPYETALERMDEEWGEWSDEDYVWSPPKEGDQAAPVSLSRDTIDESFEEDDGGESLEDCLERMDREWADWL